MSSRAHIPLDSQETMAVIAAELGTQGMAVPTTWNISISVKRYSRYWHC